MRKTRLLRIVLLAGLSWMAARPEPAWAQGSTWAGVQLARLVETARWRLGDLRVNAALRLTNVGYDSDIYYGHLGEPTPDFTASASTPVRVFYPLTKQAVLDLYDAPQYAFYLESERERTWNNIFRGQLHFAFDKLYALGGANLSDMRERVSPELNVNVRQKTDRAYGFLLWQVSKTASFAALYNWSKFDIGDVEVDGASLAESLNRKESFVDFLSYVQPANRFRLFLDAQYGTYIFTEQTSSFKDARSFGVFGGLDFVPRTGEIMARTTWQGSFSIGYVRFDLIDPTRTDGTDFAGQADISVDFLTKTTARVFFTRGFQFSIYSGSTYYLSTNYGGSLSRRLSRKMTVSYELALGRSEYPEDETAGGDAPQGTRDRYTTHMFSLDLRLSRYLSLSFLGRLGKRVQSDESLAKNRNFFGISLTYGVPTGGISLPIGGLSR